MTAVPQIHIVAGGVVQTLAAFTTATGVTLFSTHAATGEPGGAELHIPAAACAWLAGIVGRVAT